MSVILKCLMYVEDDETLSRVTSRSLSRRGYEVHHYTSLQSVHERRKDVAFSHALLDLRLNDGTTLSLIQQLCKEYSGIKIVVLTGYASIATAVQAVKWGAVNYLAKPATTEQIVRAFSEQPMGEGAVPEAVNTHDSYSLRRLEWEHIQQALTANGGNIAATARELKMHRRTLQRKLLKRPVKN